jgi:hypothetical protein
MESVATSTQPQSARGAVPALIRRPRWAVGYVALWAPYIAIYQLTNRFPVRTPVTLELSWADQLIPFAPQFLPLYVAYIPFFFWTVARSRDDREVNRIFYATYLQLLLSVPWFVLWPVAMPRHLFYGSELFGWADAFWRWFDGPNNCFPSLHASNCLLFIELNWARRRRWRHALVGAGIIAAALLVKQHYVVDMLAGAAVYLASSWMLARVEIAGLDAAGNRITEARRSGRRAWPGSERRSSPGP